MKKKGFHIQGQPKEDLQTQVGGGGPSTEVQSTQGRGRVGCGGGQEGPARARSLLPPAGFGLPVWQGKQKWEAPVCLKPYFILPRPPQRLPPGPAEGAVVLPVTLLAQSSRAV